MSKFKVGDRVRGVRADVEGYIMRIEEITPEKYIYLSLIDKGTGRFDWVKDLCGSGNPNNDGILRRKTSWERCLELVEPKQEPLTNTIITNIKDEAQHKRVQEKLFEMGCEWRSIGKSILEKAVKENHIIIESNSQMTYWGGDTIEQVRKNENGKKEITADEFLVEEKTKFIPSCSNLPVFDELKDKPAPGEFWSIGTAERADRLIKDLREYKYNTPTDTPKPIAKGNKIMSNIVSFFNDLTVSAEDKELRKAGLKDGELNWNDEAKQIVLDLEARELGYKNEQDMLVKTGTLDDEYSDYSAIEYHALFTKFYPKLLETAKKFNKREEKK